MNLGAGAYEVGVARIALAQEKESSIATWEGALPGIITLNCSV